METATRQSSEPAKPPSTGDEKRDELGSLRDVSVEYLIDPAEERAVLRKIDFIIMPAMTFVYFFQCTRRPSSVPRDPLPILGFFMLCLFMLWRGFVLGWRAK